MTTKNISLEGIYKLIIPILIAIVAYFLGSTISKVDDQQRQISRAKTEIAVLNTQYTNIQNQLEKIIEKLDKHMEQK